jgi:hypothetical protein
MPGTSLQTSSSVKKRHFFQPPIKLTTNASSSLSSGTPVRRRAAHRPSSSSRDASVASHNADDELAAKRKESTLKVLSIWDSLERRYARPLEQDDIVDLETMQVVHDRGALRSMPQRTFGTVHKPEHTNGAESSGGEDEDEEQDPEDDEDELGRWEVDDLEEVIRLRPQPNQLTVHDKNDLEEFYYAEEYRKAALGDPDEDFRQSSVESQSSFRPTPSVEQEQDEGEEEGSATDDLDIVLPRKRVQFKSLSTTPGAREYGRHNGEEEEDEEEDEYVRPRRRALVEDDSSSSDDPLATAPADDTPRYPSSERETSPPRPHNVSRVRSSSPKKRTPARPRINHQLFTPPLSKSPGRPEVPSETVRSLSRRPEADARFWPSPHDNRIRTPSRLLERGKIREWAKESFPGPSRPSPRKRKRSQSPLHTPTPDPSYPLSSRHRSTPFHVDQQGSPHQGHIKRARHLESKNDRLPPHEKLHDNHHVPFPPPTRVSYRHLEYGDELPSPSRDAQHSRAPSRTPMATPRHISELMFHLNKVNELVRHHGLEDDIHSAVPEEEAFTPPPPSRHSTLLRQQRSQPELRSFVREGSVAEMFVTPRRPRVSSGGLYEPSISSSRCSDRVFPPDTPPTLRGDSPVRARGSGTRREQVVAPSTFDRVVQVCI